MHAIKGGWSGEVFALAAGNDSGGRKSRIRRSKEERKEMVESFIKKYQKSNYGNFPSLNLTHKEVGGSFYTVREIVREIIQENRVLAPPKVLLEDDEDSGFLEQHPLGSISMEPRRDLLAPDRIHTTTNSVSAINEHRITSEDCISSLDLGDEEVCASNHDQDMNMEEVSNCREHTTGLKGLENGKIVNGIEVLEEIPQFDSDNLITENVGDHDCQGLIKEKHLNETHQIMDKNKEFRERIEILDREKNGAQDVDASRAATSHVNSDIVVEKFPLRPALWTIHEMDRGSGEVHESAIKMEDKSSQHEQTAFTLRSSHFVSEKDEEELSYSTVKSNGKFEDEKMVLNLQDPSPEHFKDSTASESSVLNIDDVTNLGPIKSSLNGTKARSSAESMISEISTAVGRKTNDPDNSSEINDETCSSKSTRPENNRVVALLKGIVSSLIKFWTE